MKYMDTIRKFISSHASASRWAGVALILAVAFAVAAYAGNQMGGSVGTGAGKAAGTAVGSFRGFTRGLPEGYEQGKEQGLSAQDIDVQIKTDLREVGSLEVLTAGVTLVDHNKIGQDFNALFRIPGNAVFTVNLKQCEVESKSSEQIVIYIPEPEMKFYPNEEKKEKLAEHQRNFWTGSAEDGFQAALNSEAEIMDNVKEHMRSYDVLAEEARRSAVRQITHLASSARGQRGTVTVEVKGGTEA